MLAATGADIFQDVRAFSSFSALSHVSYNSSSPDTPSTIDNDIDADTSTDTSTNTTPVRSGTPTGPILVLGRDRSRTVVARPIEDQPLTVPTSNNSGPSRMAPTQPPRRPRNRAVSSERICRQKLREG